MKKLIVRIKGGLGNQLFCYAAGRRLALVNNAEFVIDDVTGFRRDQQYSRRYALDNFCIPVRKATPAERMEPFERYRRGIKKIISRRMPFYHRSYLEQEGIDLDTRILDFKFLGTLYLDGFWQSEEYFKDIDKTIRKDLKIFPPKDTNNQNMAKLIRQHNAVAVHVRWFDPPGSKITTYNLSKSYYWHAITEIKRYVENPYYFIFSDDSLATKHWFDFPNERVTWVNHNHDDLVGFADLWLMTQCRHFIIANSTFSWWGAWLGTYQWKIVFAPNLQIDGKAAWGFKGLIPDRWIKL